MNWLFASGRQSFGASSSASVLPKNIQELISRLQGGKKTQMFKINHIVCPNCLDTISHTNTKKILCQYKKLCKFWQLDGGVNDDLLQDGLCHTQVCCAQSPCPCSRPLLTLTSTLKHSKEGLVQSLRGLLMCTRLCLSPPSVSGRYGV